MNRKEFRNRLNKALYKIKKKERKELLNHYDELILDYMENDMTEPEAVETLGNISDIAKDIYENIEPDKLKRCDKLLSVFIIADIFLIFASLLHAFGSHIIYHITNDGESSSISFVGGTDGPTSVFLAGKTSGNFSGWYAALILCALATVIYLIIRKHRNHL